MISCGTLEALGNDKDWNFRETEQLWKSKHVFDLGLTVKPHLGNLNLAPKNFIKCGFIVETSVLSK